MLQLTAVKILAVHPIANRVSISHERNESRVTMPVHGSTETNAGAECV